jgi:hypothetical protein
MEIIQFQREVVQSLEAFAIKDLLHNTEVLNNLISKLMIKGPSGYQ